MKQTVGGFLMGFAACLLICLSAAMAGCPLFSRQPAAAPCRCCGKDCDCCAGCRKGGACRCRNCDCCKCCPGRKQAPDCPDGRCPKKPGTGALPRHGKGCVCPNCPLKGNCNCVRISGGSVFISSECLERDCDCGRCTSKPSAGTACCPKKPGTGALPK